MLHPDHGDTSGASPFDGTCDVLENKRCFPGVGNDADLDVQHNEGGFVAVADCAL